MDWVWVLYRTYIVKQLIRGGAATPTDAQLESAFLKALSESSVTILVQEPFQGSVRFKGLARGSILSMRDLIRDPMEYLRSRYGGGKFKLNFHQGWHFVATQNFKPEGDPLWKDLPGIEF